MLLAYAAFRVPDAALVDEVVQQTFIRAYEQIRDFQPDKDFGIWLRSICRFMILAELKRATRDRQNKDNYQEHLKVRLFGEALQRGESQADEDVLRRLKGCLGRLQQTARSLVTLRYQEFSRSEIAARLGQSATRWPRPSPRPRYASRRIGEPAVSSPRWRRAHDRRTVPSARGNTSRAASATTSPWLLGARALRARLLDEATMAPGCWLMPGPRSSDLARVRRDPRRREGRDGRPR
jgi:RNA polymerase sigma factor (sigma-70 family)